MKHLNFYLAVGLLLAVTVPSFAQNTCSSSLPNRFQRGDQYYLSSMRGLRLMMADIKVEDPTLYTQLTPQFEKLVTKQRRAWKVLIPSTVIGGAMMIGGAARLAKYEDSYSVT